MRMGATKHYERSYVLIDFSFFFVFFFKPIPRGNGWHIIICTSVDSILITSHKRWHFSENRPGQYCGQKKRIAEKKHRCIPLCCTILLDVACGPLQRTRYKSRCNTSYKIEVHMGWHDVYERFYSFLRSECTQMQSRHAWWRHRMETFPALLAICVGNPPVTGEFPTQRSVTRRFDVFFDLHLNKSLSKQSCSDNGLSSVHSQKCTWKYCRQNGGHFVPPLIRHHG